ncbi:hypothetical protein [Rhizobium sp.]|jgi:hypothetical protein|uniref:hypothetical protein n=1 Tax=Rhizobium sp. TaxID=391 RepID=UPI000E919336|nr:hypothetical protein [Rhizobium sp.]
MSKQHNAKSSSKASPVQNEGAQSAGPAASDKPEALFVAINRFYECEAHLTKISAEGREDGKWHAAKSAYKNALGALEGWVSRATTRAGTLSSLRFALQQTQRMSDAPEVAAMIKAALGFFENEEAANSNLPPVPPAETAQEDDLRSFRNDIDEASMLARDIGHEGASLILLKMIETFELMRLKEGEIWSEMEKRGRENEKNDFYDVIADQVLALETLIVNHPCMSWDDVQIKVKFAKNHLWGKCDGEFEQKDFADVMTSFLLMLNRGEVSA